MPDPLPLREDDPDQIGGCDLVGRLGAGGQGTVYLAESSRGGARVAIKTLNSEGLSDPRVRQRFVREVEAARQVASFCTAAVLEADFDAAVPHIVSEYVEGQSLSQRIRQGGPMAGGDLIRLAVATATALVAIHEAGIVHRDFKPGNVLLGDGGARVIDFGIAQLTEGAGTLTNSTIGTPAFMAPEQIGQGNATPASDVFAWGAVMAFAATGSSPFDGGTVPNVLHNVLYVEPELSALPDEVRPLVAAALAKDPAARPAAVDALMTLLGRQGRPIGPDGLNQAMREAHTSMVDGGAVPPTWNTPYGGPPPAHTAVGGAAPGMPPPTWNTPYGGPPRARTSNSRLISWLVGIGVVLVVGATLVAGVLIGNVEGAAGNGEDSGAEESGDSGESTSIYDVKVGDCYNEPDEYGATTELDVIDCGEPHDAEVYAIFQLEGNREWPGESTIDAEAQAECEGDVFESYVGTEWDSSKYDKWYYTPDEDLWEDGDYEVICSAIDPESMLTGSVADSGE